MSASAEHVSAPTWFKSSYSGSGPTECVECAGTAHGTLVRDSKRAGGGVIAVGGEAWQSFVGGVARGIRG